MAELPNSTKWTVPKIVFVKWTPSTRYAVYEAMEQWSNQYSVEYRMQHMNINQIVAQLPTVEHNSLFGITWNPASIHYLEYRIVEWL